MSGIHGRGGPVRHTWSGHAKARRKQMGLTEHRVEAVIDDPELTYRAPRDGKDYVHYVGNGLCIPVDPDGVIVTVLWHGAHGRTDDGKPVTDVTLTTHRTTDRLTTHPIERTP